MKVELEGSLGKAMLKECLWMGKSEVSPEEGEQDETSQKPTLRHEPDSSAKTYDKEVFPKFYYLL